MAPNSPTKKKLDRVFSEYIRRSAADKNGIVRCYTCAWIGGWKDCDAGHYITRDHMATRWDERNVKPQCQHCNRFKSGVSDEFALHLVRDYGQDVLDELNRAKWTPTRMGEYEMLGFLEHYKGKLKALSV